MDYKKAFYSKLQDCYLGVKIKKANENSVSNSGFTNLLDIKSKYFEFIKKYLEKEIDTVAKEWETNDIYNKLYTFFDSFLNETGTPFFTDTPIYKNIYAKIYSNSKDTNLFYKTQNLYYVKSDTLYNSLIVEDKNFSLNFDASEYKQNADNNKNKVFFKLYSIDTNENIPQITIKVSNQKDLFEDLNSVFKSNSNEFNDDFLKALKDKKLINLKNEDEISNLKNIFNSYKKQNEVDFFIHKNAKAFLEEQFDLWMFSHLYKDSEIQQWDITSIERLQKIRNIAFKIIYFIGRFEDELKALWLKPKFAKKTNEVEAENEEGAILKVREVYLPFVDFCAGIGGGRLGLELNGFKCLGFSEIDKEAIKTYKVFFDTSNEIEFGDLTKINPRNLPNFDLIISGFPCQTFSIVGKRAGLNDKNKGQIIFYLAEILKVKQPKFFIFENVKGLINHNKGQTLTIILKLLKDCGYKVYYKVLNSKDFNLAQSRERVYFVGFRKDLNINKDFFASLSSANKANLKDCLKPLPENRFDINNPTFIKYLNNKYNFKRFVLEEILSRDFLIIDIRQSDLRVYDNQSPTLRRDRQGLLYTFNKELYKISALEALRLQGFNALENIDEKIKDLKSSDILRQCGNAMSVNVIQAIAKRILEVSNG